MKTYAPPFQLLHAALHALETGKSGFELVISELLSAATNQQMQLMASGEQGGVDAIQPSHQKPRRAMQAKRYLARTALDFTALRGEMDDAVEAFAGLDCWILATTKPVRGQGSESLERHAERLGLGLVILDWGGTADYPPNLAVLCAAYPEIVINRCGQSLVDELQAIRLASNYQHALKNLSESLSRPSFGFAAARNAAIERLSLIFRDAAAARTIAGPSPRYLSGPRSVARPAIDVAISDWWQSNATAIALTGDEGAGKTWAALFAMRNLAGDHDGPLPVILKAEDTKSKASALEVVLENLCDLSRRAQMSLSNDRAFWERKLHSWATISTDRPRIVVLVDGLDEAQNLSWVGWLSPLVEQTWNGLFRLIITSRRDWWTVGLSELRSLQGGEPVKTILIPNFTEEERNAFLEVNRIDPQEVAPNVLLAALHPRTAFHLVRLSSRLKNLKTVTRERLLLLDFENRWNLKDHASMRHDQFAKLIESLALDARNAALEQKSFSIEESAAADRASKLAVQDRSELRAILTELVDGRWLERSSHEKTKFEFKDAYLPDAVGMALASEIRHKKAEEVIDSLNRFLEPWGADDLTEKVLRMCATALILDVSVGDDVCRTVLQRWLARPIRAHGGQDFWRRLTPIRLPLFLGICGEEGGQNSDWIQEWSLACCWEDHPQLRPMVEASVFDWCRDLPLDPERSASDREEYRIYNMKRLRQLRQVRALKNRGMSFWADLIGLEGSAQRFTSAMRIISMLPRQSFVPALAAWSIVRAVARVNSGHKEVAWLLRENIQDDAETVVAMRGIIELLLTRDERSAKRAAGMLLEALGWEEDALRARDAGQVPEAIHSNKFGFEGDLRISMSPDYDPKHWIASLSEISKQSRDPNVTADSLALEEFESLARKLTPGAVSTLARFTDDHFFPLLRWSSESFIARCRQFGLTVDRGVVERSQFLLQIMPLLTSEELNIIHSYLVQVLNEIGSGPLREREFAIGLARRDLSHQLREMNSVQNQSAISTNLAYLLTSPSESEVEDQIAKVNFDAPVPEQQSVLFTSLRLIERFEAPRAFPIFDWSKAFTQHDPALRQKAFQLAYFLKDETASKWLVTHGWQASQETDLGCRFFGSELLLFQDDTTLGTMLGHLLPATCGKVFSERPALRSQALDLWEAWLVDKISTPRNSISMGGDDWSYRLEIQRSHFAAYVDLRSDAAVRVLRAGWDDKRCHINFAYVFGSSPAWRLIEAVGDRAPELCESIWRGLSDRGSHGFTSGALRVFPFHLNGHPIFAAMRATALEHARTDSDLLEIAITAQEYDHSSWLGKVVRDDIQSASIWKRARGWTLAGFLDGPMANEIWQDLVGSMPSSGWLADVAARSQQWHLADVRSRYWMEVALHEKDEDAAWRAYQLGVRDLDERFQLWWGSGSHSLLDESWRSRWINYNGETRSIRIKNARDSITKTRFHSDPCSNSINH